ncbi:MAG TPA: pilus assembly protein TadG-related protein [Terracidiphilus sp.]|nr:pilus assembly protein TadG-related protein [Terracidiphilus sp.]
MKMWRDASGQVLIITALSMTVLLGFVAFATDVGLMLRQRRMAQTAADSAALAAATELLYESNPSSVTTGIWDAASHDASLNGFTPGSWSGVPNTSSKVTLIVNIAPNISIPNFNYPTYAQATVSLNTETVFMKMFGINSMNVGATAIASNSITSGGCIYVQNPGDSADPAVDMGGSSLITSPNCAVSVNGDINMSGNAKINARYVAATGSIEGKNAGNGWAPGSAPQDDPLAYLQGDAYKPTYPGAAGAGTCDAPPGSGLLCVYDYGCGSTSCLLKDITLTDKAVYYYDKPLNISGNVTGGPNGNTIYLATKTAYLDFNSIGTLSITPPGTDCEGGGTPLCGVVIDAPIAGKDGAGTYSCSSGNGNNGQNPGEMYFDFGSSTTSLTGVVYAPYMQIFVMDQGAKKSGGVNLNADVVVGNICAQSGDFTVNGLSGPLNPLTRVGLVY